MHRFLRPRRTSYRIPGLAPLLCVALSTAAGLLAAPRTAQAQSAALAHIFADPYPFIAHAVSSGYLGVDVTDVDAEKAQELKLNEARGALITLIDHDAPAGQIGLKVNDVVLAIDGQSVNNAEQFRGLLRAIPPGRKVSLEISRDGSLQTLAVALVDHKVMEQSIWSKIVMEADSIVPGSHDSAPAMGLVGNESASAPSSRFHMPFFSGALNVGVMVEPLTSQMSDSLGIEGGVMVKQVSKQSEAAVAGFKAFDVVLKVGDDSIVTSADWERALRSHEGSQVTVTILRDKKQQMLTLQVDSKHRSAVEFKHGFTSADAPELADTVPAFNDGAMRSLAAPARSPEFFAPRTVH